ncbi:hypothetical protein X474_19705 [Dethiosulfatarculus sandiegensis]|uniref:Uncharacterized protein n=1 Tax=Dethiosulfatarculus sandiegensis TaxID=1429043 RepID=A0A0D2J1Z5_9BACT|nr:hypothetical protein X474_19705 [Dethiosulfatarculus sandiegensis]
MQFGPAKPAEPANGLLRAGHMPASWKARM